MMKKKGHPVLSYTGSFVDYSICVKDRRNKCQRATNPQYFKQRLCFAIEVPDNLFSVNMYLNKTWDQFKENVIPRHDKNVNTL